MEVIVKEIKYAIDGTVFDGAIAINEGKSQSVQQLWFFTVGKDDLRNKLRSPDEIAA
jgi:hypothetical protein